MKRNQAEPKTAEASVIGDHLKGMPADMRARAFARFVGMVEIRPNVYRADPKLVDVAKVMAVVELADLVQLTAKDEPEARTNLVFCFPSIPPR